jgi:hypothetical protein
MLVILLGVHAHVTLSTPLARSASCQQGTRGKGDQSAVSVSTVTPQDQEAAYTLG